MDKKSQNDEQTDDDKRHQTPDEFFLMKMHSVEFCRV